MIKIALRVMADALDTHKNIMAEQEGLPNWTAASITFDRLNDKADWHRVRLPIYTGGIRAIFCLHLSAWPSL
jgi:hypothetical protein